MSAPSAVSAARVLLVERRDTVAQRDPNAPKVRRYRLARLQLNGRATGATASSTCAAPTTEARDHALAREYPRGMENEKTGPSFGARILAAIVLAFAAWILFKVIIGIVAGVAYFLVVVVAVIAVIWAVRTLF